MRDISLTRDIKKFLEPYGREIVQLVTRARSILFKEAPGAIELVCDAYNAVALGYSFTGRPSDAFCHIAAYSKWVNLGFNHGAELDDPGHLLVGSGRRVRHIRIERLSDLEQEFVRNFIRAAIAPAKRTHVLKRHGTSPPTSIVRAIYPKRRRPKRKD